MGVAWHTRINGGPRVPSQRFFYLLYGLGVKLVNTQISLQRRPIFCLLLFSLVNDLHTSTSSNVIDLSRSLAYYILFEIKEGALRLFVNLTK